MSTPLLFALLLCCGELERLSDTFELDRFEQQKAQSSVERTTGRRNMAWKKPNAITMNVSLKNVRKMYVFEKARNKTPRMVEAAPCTIGVPR